VVVEAAAWAEWIINNKVGTARRAVRSDARAARPYQRNRKSSAAGSNFSRVFICTKVAKRFGVRRQSAAATALSHGVAHRNDCGIYSQSGVALRLPPQSKMQARGFHEIPAFRARFFCRIFM
jgi:hypothetical protein